MKSLSDGCHNHTRGTSRIVLQLTRQTTSLPDTNSLL